MIDEDTREANPTPTADFEGVSAPVDYWGTDERHKHMLPDGTQWFEFKIMDEGAKVEFQKLTNQDLTIGRDNTAKVRVDPATERHTLIETSVVDWYLVKIEAGVPQPVAYSKQLLRKWLTVAPPKIVEDLERAIRLANPWMQAEMKVADIDEEIDRLREQRKQAIEREAGEPSSATK